MKIYMFALLVVTTIAIAFPHKDKNTAVSLDLLPQKKDEYLKLQVTSVKEHYRTRRFICDISNNANADRACAAHCSFREKIEGKCNSDRVCMCRNGSVFG